MENYLHNPIANMDRYPPDRLESMSLDQLIAAQRDCLFQHEQEMFDRDEPIFFKRADKRNDFFDFTDRLICQLMIG